MGCEREGERGCVRERVREGDRVCVREREREGGGVNWCARNKALP